MQYQTSLLEPIWVDCFAGGGGWSTGAELAIGRPMDIAINHDPAAVLMHKTNHPYTKHYCEDIFEVDPREAVQGRHVQWAHFSPDCKHFSKAKGGKPVGKRIRGLAWVVLKWAALVKPDIISLENVEEFQTWGPVKRGRPVKAKAGQTFERWKSQLEALGYVVEHRELVACDYGAPTSRKRFFLIARRDSKPIVWPEPTHGDPESEAVKSGKLKPWRTAAEIIDWSLPCPSIFDTAEQIKDKHGLRAQRPLANATMQRIARGLEKFVLQSSRPFIVPWTVTNVTNATGHPVNEPVDTIRTGGGGGQMLVTPVMTAIAQTGFKSDRCRAVTQPIATVVSKAEICLMTPSLVQYHAGTDARGQTVADPIMTIDAAPRYAMSAAYLSEYYGNAQDGLQLDHPLHTVTSKDREGITVAHISKYFGGVVGSDADSPLPTVTAVDHNAVEAVFLGKWYNTCTGQELAEPLHTITTSPGHFGLVTIKLSNERADLGHWPGVRALLNQYCGYSLADDEVLLLVIGGIAYYISDIGLRMLIPRELFSGQGFPFDYIIERDYTGKAYPKTKQVARAGNAVPPQYATALVRANAPECCCKGLQTMAELNNRIAI